MRELAYLLQLHPSHMSFNYFARSFVLFINDELRSVGRGARGAVTFPRLLSWQPVSTHPGAQGPSDINLIKLSSITDYGKHLNTSVCLGCSKYLTAIHRLKLNSSLTNLQK